MNYIRKVALVIAAALALSAPVNAQWQTPNHSVPIGEGGGNIGFNSAAPGASGTVLMSNGASVDPTFQALPAIPAVPGTRSVTGNDTATAADCNKVILASGGFNTLTLPAASAVTAGCKIGFRNNEVYTTIGSARGKRVVGFPSDFTPDGRNIMYPNQSGTVVSDGTNWSTVDRVGQWLMPTSAELCARQDGDNTSDGLGNGTVASGCLSSIQTAIITIGKAWNGLGYNACSIGLYAGGTSIFNESTSQTGQSIGCYLTFNVRGAVTWTSTGPCLNAGDNSVTIINWNLGFIPTFKCNTNNAAGSGQFYCHQTCIFDFNGGAAIWIPGGVEGLGTGGTKGTNDVFFYVDLQGSASYNAQVNVGNGVDTYNPLAFTFAEGHASQVTLSGTVASSALVTWQQALVMQVGSLITHNLTWPGASVTNATKVRGNSILVQGAAVPGPAAVAGNGGVICTSKACP